MKKWIQWTLCDESGRPSSTRQAGFATLFFLFVAIGMDWNSDSISSMALLAGSLFGVGQLGKLAKSKSTKSEAI